MPDEVKTPAPLPTREEALIYLNTEKRFTKFIDAAGLGVLTDEPASVYFIVNDMVELATNGDHAKAYGAAGLLQLCRDKILAADGQPTAALLDALDKAQKATALPKEE